MSGCVFCAIAAGTVKARIAHRDAEFTAFHDINPQAPVHLLVVPAAHAADLGGLDEGAAGRMMLLCARLAAEAGLAGGYRLVVNTGADGGQSVAHVHVHILGGRALRWPPG